MFKTIKKVVKYSALIVLLYGVSCAIIPFNSYLKKRSIENQIYYLNDLLTKGYDDKLQEKYPEGKLFSNAIFSLSVIEYTENYNKSSRQYSKILDDNIARILSDKTLEPFNSSMNPTYGMFYNAWTNYVLSKYLASDLYEFSSIKRDVELAHEKIDKRILDFQQDSIQIIDSYKGMNWPADNLVGILSIKDKKIQQEWFNLIQHTSTHPSGLIHHSGSDNTEIRGSSQALLMYGISQLEQENKVELNNQFNEYLIDEYLGIQLVKEYEENDRNADFDSGPIFFGYGASATIMNIKTQANFEGNKSKAKRTWALMNAISVPINFLGNKFYLFKQEPMFDIFMLWTSVDL